MRQQKLTERIYYKIRDKISYSITIGNYSILCIEAKENRYIVLTDIFAAFLQLEMNKEVHMLLERVNRQNRAKTIQEIYMEEQKRLTNVICTIEKGPCISCTIVLEEIGQNPKGMGISN